VRQTAGKKKHKKEGDISESPTLAAIVRERVPGMTWKQAKAFVVGGHVFINGQVLKDPAARPAENRRIEFVENPAGYIAPGDPRRAVRVNYLDEHIVVVEKPAGLTTVRHAKEKQEYGDKAKYLPPALVQLLPRLVAAAERSSFYEETPIRSVHRLDKATSGLVVFARTKAAVSVLADDFRDHRIRRVYTGVVQGCVKDCTIKNLLARDRGDGRRGSHPSCGKRAVTHIRLVEDLGAYSVVRCRLETGRTHQVRIHLAEAGYPLCGERLYSLSSGRMVQKDTSGADRLMLHAGELGLVHPVTGNRMRFRMKLPNDMKKLIKKLRSC